MIKKIVLTPGQPGGIGIDCTIALAQQPQQAEIIAMADPQVIEARAKKLGQTLKLSDYNPDATTSISKPGQLKIFPFTAAEPDICGSTSTKNASYILATLERATEGCLNNEFHALVTGPVNKTIINEAGYNFQGHTEYLAKLTHTTTPVMLLVAKQLRVALATTHVPLRDVPKAMNQAKILQTLEVLHQDLQLKFAIANPKILVCGLNPHAGEGGFLGTEELNVIAPAVKILQQKGYKIIGPVPGDTAFIPERLQTIDAVLAMYHDQGLTVIKHLGFGQAVNVTLGLPIIRTSVDHGTALDIAGTGKASASSLQKAVDMALKLVNNLEA
ncbi:MAG: 4-hydroxythreonine-4-phosphate dehydrogenase PdxA [Pseudomonadota bacterium]